jgi:hypothetical protein
MKEQVDFFFHSIPTASLTHPASCPIGTARFIPAGKATGVWSFNLLSKLWSYNSTPPIHHNCVALISIEGQFLLPPLWSIGLISQFLHHSQTVGLLGRVISSSQGLYLNTGQHKHRKTRTHIKNPCLEWDSNPRSRPQSERRQCMP